MREDKDVVCYRLLMKIFRDNAYASIELNAVLPHCEREERAYITRLFYGVLERNVYYEYVLQGFATAKPQKAVATLIKMGYYLLENMRMPDYAAVDNIVKLSKKVGKGGASGFINSALRHFAPPVLPPEGTVAYLSVRYSYPLWLCKYLVADYGYAFVKDMLAYQAERRTHIRVNVGTISVADFAEKYANSAVAKNDIEKTETGYLVSRQYLAQIPNSDYIVQSQASIAAAQAYLSGMSTPEKILDLCAAPGGKAALLASWTGARVTACDIHPHRVELIRKYAFHCDVRLTPTVNDATIFRSEWENAFDLVICDVPCSGIGVVGSKPDILFNRSQEDVDILADRQKKILYTASRYVKPGGRLCYSTCTIIKKENEDIITEFLQTHKEFATEKIRCVYTKEEATSIRLFPHLNGTDGFFVTAMHKKETENGNA